MKTDIKTVDRNEIVSLIEPLLLGPRHREKLTDMALDLARKSAGFRASLPANSLTSLAALVRSMNCYYSNLIEGHRTHPVEIEQALRDEYSSDRGKRDLQIEAKAHIAVQQWIDEGGDSEAALRSRRTGCAKYTAASASYCRKIFFGWKIQKQESGFA